MAIDTSTEAVATIRAILDRRENSYLMVDPEQRSQWGQLFGSLAAERDAAVQREEKMREACDHLRQDNERLRWRHPMVLPDWNDLPQGLRTKLVEIGGYHSDSHEAGGDLAVNFYAEIRRARDAAMESKP